MSHLQSFIKEKICQSGGRLSFAEFMNHVLYHPTWGYYNRDTMTIGAGGDFYTAPMIHPIFGQCVARQILELWEHMGKPASFTVVEMGAGNGTLAYDMLKEWEKSEPFFHGLTYDIVEQSPSLQEKQKQRLARVQKRINWYETLSQVPEQGNLQGVIVTNELFDALPLHRLMWEKGQLVERYVTYDEDCFQEVSGPLSDPRLADIAGCEVISQIREGDRLDVCLQAVEVMQEMSHLLARGFVLTFDYGDTQPDVYIKYVHKGGIRCYYRQQLKDDPYQGIGEQDITADVDFTLLHRVGQTVGLQTAGLTSQAHFLAGLGFLDKVKELGEKALLDLNADFELQRMLTLFLPHGLGDAVKVLVQYKNTEKPVLKGLTARW